MTAARQPALFDLGEPAITDAMLRDLAKLEAAKPGGIPRHGNDYADFAKRRVAKSDAARLKNQGLAADDYGGRTPRLKITAKGRKALAASEPAR